MTYRDTNRPRQLHRSRRDSVMLGVCGGLAHYFDFAPWGVRLLFVLLSLLGFFPFTIMAYIILAFVLKPEPERRILMPGEEGRPLYGSREEALHRVQQRYEQIEQRLRRLESIVTRPGFDIDEQLRG